MRIQLHFPCLVSSQNILGLIYIVKEVLGVALAITDDHGVVGALDIAGYYKYVTLGAKNKFNLASLKLVVKTWAVMEKLFVVDVVEVKKCSKKS